MECDENLKLVKNSKIRFLKTTPPPFLSVGTPICNSVIQGSINLVISRTF